MKINDFIQNIKNTDKIPTKDKLILIVFFASPFFPILFIPEFISGIGFFITLFTWSFILDYFFNVLDQVLFLSLYPYDMKSYNQLKRASNFLTVLTPSSIASEIWTYKKDPI